MSFSAWMFLPVDAPVLFLGVFLCPRCTPGLISISISLKASFWARANFLTFEPFFDALGYSSFDISFRKLEALE